MGEQHSALAALPVIQIAPGPFQHAPSTPMDPGFYEDPRVLHLPVVSGSTSTRLTMTTCSRMTTGGCDMPV